MKKLFVILITVFNIGMFTSCQKEKDFVFIKTTTTLSNRTIPGYPTKSHEIIKIERDITQREAEVFCKQYYRKTTKTQFLSIGIVKFTIFEEVNFKEIEN